MTTYDSISKTLFGDKGLTGGVLDVLKSTGVLKDPEIVVCQEGEAVCVKCQAVEDDSRFRIALMLDMGL